MIETAAFIARAKSRMTRDEVEALIRHLAENPDSGDVMEGTGGVRKVRFAVGGRGKSSGVRVVYYYHGAHIPLFLLTVFAKNEKSNLTMAERNMVAKLVKDLVRSYRAH